MTRLITIFSIVLTLSACGGSSSSDTTQETVADPVTKVDIAGTWTLSSKFDKCPSLAGEGIIYDFSANNNNIIETMTRYNSSSLIDTDSCQYASEGTTTFNISSYAVPVQSTSDDFKNAMTKIMADIFYNISYSSVSTTITSFENNKISYKITSDLGNYTVTETGTFTR